LILDCVVYSKICSLCRRRSKKDDHSAAAGDDDVVDIDVADSDDAQTSTVDDDDDDDDDAVNDDAKDNDDDETTTTDSTHHCPKNFTGSAKSMESVGAVELVTRSYNSNEYWVEAIVGDDDSTSRAALTTDLKLYQAVHPDEPKANYWPRNDDGKFLPSKGKLHWDVKGPTTFLCDPNHRQRVVGGHIFGMAAQTAKTRVTEADAEQLKRNLGYAHKQSVNKPFDEYRKAMKAALLHHGNDHSCCDPAWCAFARGAKDVNENEKYLIIGTQRWNNLKSVFDTYTTDEMLRMTYHPFDSQKNESLNTKIAVVAPKTKTFCSTMSLSDCVAFVVITDSIGCIRVLRTAYVVTYIF